MIIQQHGLYSAASIDVNTIPQEQQSNVIPDYIKDRIEWQLLHWALEKEVPILGICRGCQFLNLALGGTLYADIATEVGHLLLRRQ